jgi:hypothetical protein
VVAQAEEEGVVVEEEEVINARKRSKSQYHCEQQA